MKKRRATPTPRRRADRTGTADALITAARRLFAQRGYDATPVRMITAAAGANLGAITYHFGSKRALYLEVLRRTLAPFAGRILEAAEGEGDALARARAVVGAYAEALRAHPDVPHLMLQEITKGGQPPEPIAEVLTRVSSALARLVEDGQAEGSVRAGEPFLFALSMVAQPLYFAIVARTMAAVVGLDQSDPVVRERVVAHAADFVVAGMRQGGVA